MRLTLPRRGGVQDWSTSFHLDTAVPDLTTFEDLADILAGWNDMWYPEVELVGIDYYPAGTNVATHTKAYSVAGSGTPGTTQKATSDSVALVRWSTTQRSSKNHPIYLYNYIHGVRKDLDADGDVLQSGQRSRIASRMGQLVSGVTANSVTFHRAGPNGAVAQDVQVEEYITHRDFPA